MSDTDRCCSRGKMGLILVLTEEGEVGEIGKADEGGEAGEVGKADEGGEMGEIGNTDEGGENVDTLILERLAIGLFLARAVLLAMADEE